MVTSGKLVAASISDNGCGIPAETMPQIFGPFYTTKEVGKGTGLGLSQVYGFAKQSGGDVTVESEVGRGARFTLYLPNAENVEASARAETWVAETRLGEEGRGCGPIGGDIRHTDARRQRDVLYRGPTTISSRRVADIPDGLCLACSNGSNDGPIGDADQVGWRGLHGRSASLSVGVERVFA
jgi:hypothetical protein